MKLCLVTILCLSTLPFQNLNAQTTLPLQERLAQTRPNCQDVIENACQVLPGLYTQNQFDSIAFVAQYIEQNCPGNNDVFYLKILLAIQNRNFDEHLFFDSSTIVNLRTIADQIRYQDTYYNNGYGRHTSLYRFEQNWAANLLKFNNLSHTEIFVMQVMTGALSDPDAHLASHSADYPYLSSLIKTRNKKRIKEQRTLMALTTGAWVPLGNLQILGVHPTIGGLLGYRTHANEFDVNVAAKFIKSPNLYQVSRKDSLYTTDYFSGIYAGLDYTRYIVQRSNYEMGLLAGLGYDGFNIASEGDDDDHGNDYLKPLSISTLNANAGLRFNYYFPRNLCIGLMARYNLVNYKNSGGTIFNGDCLTVNFVISPTNLFENRY